MGSENTRHRISNSWYHRDYLNVSTKPVIPWASLTLAMTLHLSSTWVWVRSWDSVRVLEQGGQNDFLEKPGRGDFLPRQPALSVQAVIIWAGQNYYWFKTTLLYQSTYFHSFSQVHALLQVLHECIYYSEPCNSACITLSLATVHELLWGLRKCMHYSEFCLSACSTPSLAQVHALLWVLYKFMYYSKSCTEPAQALLGTLRMCN